MNNANEYNKSKDNNKSFEEYIQKISNNSKVVIDTMKELEEEKNTKKEETNN